jgi:Domain of unknown function (DUF4145)
MSNNFEIQIEKLQKQINELKKEAENLQKSNPGLAVVNARKACEAICTHICFKAGLIKDRRSQDLNTKIFLISQNGQAPRHILDDIRFIQKKGNTVIHSIEKINSEDAEPVLNALANLVNWYFNGTTLQKPDSEESEGSSKITTEINNGGFLETVRETYKKPWVKILSVAVMSATATVLAAKGLKK